MTNNVIILVLLGKYNLKSEFVFFFFLDLFIYLRERNAYVGEGQREQERASEHEQGKGAKGEADSPLSGEPNMGLDPRTLRS